MIERLMEEMIKYYSKDPKRIQHFIKVHSFARFIGIKEGLDKDTMFILETAALVHDIGIKESEKQFGNCNGKLQEKMGPPIAKELLKRLGFAKEVIERVEFLVGHHHTYDDIQGMDYQILVEADFLVNYYEDELKKESIFKSYEKIFVTETGKILCKDMYL